MKQLSSTLGLVVAFLLSCSTPASALSNPPLCPTPQLNVYPFQPGCQDEITLTVSFQFPSTCWSVEEPVDFVEDASGYWFGLEIHHQQTNCSDVIVDRSFAESVGPVPAGSYTFGTHLNIYSNQYGNASCFYSVPLNVTCCATSPPQAVSNLRLAKIAGGPNVRLTWSNVPDATSYVVYADPDSLPDFMTSTVLGTSTSGTVGFQLGPSAWYNYYRVVAHNGCGSGPSD